jgi:hypothetical protein
MDLSPGEVPYALLIGAGPGLSGLIGVTSLCGVPYLGTEFSGKTGVTTGGTSGKDGNAMVGGAGIAGVGIAGAGFTGTGITGAVAGGGIDGIATVGEAVVPPGGKSVGAASLLGLGATILEALNFGGSVAAAMGVCPETKAISDSGSEVNPPSLDGIGIGSGTGGKLGINPPSGPIELESTTIGFARTAE